MTPTQKAVSSEQKGRIFKDKAEERNPTLFPAPEETVLPGYINVDKAMSIEDERLEATKAEYKSCREHVDECLAGGDDMLAMAWNNRMNFIASRLLSEARRYGLLCDGQAASNGERRGTTAPSHYRGGQRA